MADEPMNAAAKAPKPGVVQQSALFVLRIGVGWHFLYEGIVKLVDPNWTSAPYLAESKWIFSDLFHWMASTPSVLNVPWPPPGASPCRWPIRRA